MTQYTPNLNLPYPEAGDAPRGNEQIQALATSLDNLTGFPVAHGLFRLGQNTTLTEDRASLPLVAQSVSGVTLSGSTVTLTQAGIWFVTATAAINGQSGGTGGLYITVTGLTGTNAAYGCSDYSSGRRMSVTVGGMFNVAAEGTSFDVQGWWARSTAGTGVEPAVGGLTLAAVLLSPAAAA